MLKSIKNLYVKLKESAEFCVDYHVFRSKMKDSRFGIRWRDRYPCLKDKLLNTVFDRHYVYHTAWAARIVAQTLPKKHIDISSFIYFSTIISSFIPVDFFDYRPAKIELEGLTSGAADILNLPFPDNSIHSLSCMHVVEHIGLGRYRDQINPDGDLRAISELQRVTAKNGNLLFVVPIGRPKIMFNAHRIYSYENILEYFKNFELVEFTLIRESSSGGLIKNATKGDADSQTYGCGCFWFKKTEKQQ